MHIQLSLSLHLYLLYFLLNSCDGNDAFWRHSMLVKQSSSFSRKHRILSLQVHKQPGPKPGWPQNLGIDAGMCVRCRRHLSATPATWSRASLTHGQARQKTSSTKESVTEKAVTCKHEGKRTSLWTYAKLNPALYRATNSLPKKTRFASFPSQLRLNTCDENCYKRTILIQLVAEDVVTFFWDTVYITSLCRYICLLVLCCDASLCD